MHSAQPVRIVLRAPIRYDTDGDKQSHAPMVRATVGAIHTRLILDTGSDVHLLTREVAEAAGLQLSSVDTGTDHAGSSMESWLLGSVPVELTDASPGPVTVVLDDVVAIPAPAAFTAQGIGGILSPQRLHATAFAVIDQVDHELVVVDATAAEVRTWLLERRPTSDVLVLPRRHGDDRPIVEAAIEPHPALPVLVNTGGRHTEIDPGAVPGLAGGNLERIGTGVSGAPVMGASAGRQVVRVAGGRVSVTSVMLREGMADPSAMLGQDVLRDTVVALASDTATPVLWQVATLADDVAEPS